MKWIAMLLFIYTSLLVAGPAICSVEKIMAQADACCHQTKKKDCTKDENSKQDAPCMPCCVVQTCQCEYISPVNIDFTMENGGSITAIPDMNDKIHSDYWSECWHPPETV